MKPNGDPDCMELGKALGLRAHTKSCASCRYWRIVVETNLPSASGDCLLLGRLMAISTDVAFVRRAGHERVCDGWKRRPKTWKEETSKNPYWEDAYISRESQRRIRLRAYKKAQRRQLTDDAENNS